MHTKDRSSRRGRRRASRHLPHRHALTEALERRQLLSTTFYVSPTGSNSNSGKSPSSPWQTVAKVNATAFAAGDQILFERGGQWHETLTASSSGRSGSPIVYGAYGSTSAAKPLFVGSNQLNPASFSLVSGTTYSMSSSTVINWVFDNHQFLHSASVNTTSVDVTTDVNYVKANTDTFFYDTVGATLYINLGSAPTGHTLTGAVRQDGVFNNGKSFVTFDELATTETADANGGYGFHAQAGKNVTFMDCDASLAGKHHFADIDSTAFRGVRLLADQSPPDLGFGGASAFVSFSDNLNGRSGDTSQWIDDTYTNPNGPYPAFLTHGDPGAIGSVLVQNLTSLNGFGTGIVIQPTGPSERATILGGHVDGGTIEIDTDNSVVDGVTLTGDDGLISLNGSNDVAQNCLITGIAPNPQAGHPGGVIDTGQGNTVRFNTFHFDSPGGPAVAIATSTSNSKIYGNIFDDQQPIRLMFDGGNGQVDSHDNIFGTTFAPTPTIGTGSVNFPSSMTFAQWQALGRDTNSVVADPKFTGPANGDFSLTADSPAIDLYTATPDASVTTINKDINGDLRPQGAGRDAGAFERQPIVPQVSVADVTVAAPAAGGTTTAVFNVTLDQAAASAVSVHFATADGTGTAGTDYDAASGTLSFAVGETSKTVSVTVNGIAGVTSDRTFVLNLSSPSNATIGTSQATATITPQPTGTTETFDARHVLSYLDSGNRRVLVRLIGPGSGQATFDTGVADPSQIMASNTTAASALIVTTIGGVTTLGDVIVPGSLGVFGGVANLGGNLDIVGSVRGVVLRDVSGSHTITIGQAGAVPVVLRLGNVTDLSVTSAAPIAALTASSWTDTDATPDTITAPSINALTIAGASNVSLNVSGTIGVARVVGAISGAWTVGGGSRAIVAGSVASNWSGTFGGDIAALATFGNFDGSLTAASVRAMRVGGDLAGTLHFANDAGTLFVVGLMNGATVRSDGNIAAVVAGAMIDSTVTAGVNASVVGPPTSASAFLSPSHILVLAVRGRPGLSASFAGSTVAASSLGRVLIGGAGVLTTNGGTPFGIAAQSITSYVEARPSQRPFVWTSRQGPTLLPAVDDYQVTIV